MSGSWKTSILIFTLLQVIALAFGIAGRKSVAGRIAVVLSTLVVGVGLPVIALILAMNVSKDFGGTPSFERLTSATDKSQDTGGFGPAVERVITIGNEPHSLYSLDKGDYVPGPPLAAPEDFSALDWQKEGERLGKWLTENDVDFLSVRKDGKPVLIFSDMVCGPPVDEGAFDRWTSPGRMASIEFKHELARQFRPAFQPAWTGFPGRLTEPFQTRYERIGMVQILGVTNDPPGVRIRYKLAQPQGAATKGNPKVIAHQGPPFVAHLRQGSVELLGLAPHPSGGAQSWLADGSPSKEPLPNGAGVNSADGKAMKEIAFRIRSTGLPSAPELRFDKESGTSGMGSSFGSDGHDPTVFTLVQAMACPLAAKSINLKLGVAEGDWETVSSTSKPTVNMNSGWSGAQTSDKDGVWEGNVQMTEGNGGDVTLAFNYSIKDEFETRIAYVRTDGAMLPLSGSGSYGAGGLRHGITTMKAPDFSQIKEFQLQRRRYQWVEFRNVSLEPGHRTSVETVDAPGSPTKADRLQSG